MKRGRKKQSVPAIAEWLVPAGGVEVYRSCRSGQGPESRERHSVYELFSSISSAMRERAEDQARSTERSDSASASAVSAVVRPAK